VRSTSLYKRRRSDLYRVNQTQTRHAGVAGPSENASRLTADVQLDDGSPLELGVAGFCREQTSVATPKVARLRAGSQDDGYVVACTRTAIITKTDWGDDANI